MDRAFQQFITKLILFILFSMLVVGILMYLCHEETRKPKEYESCIITDERRPSLKEIERKALSIPAKPNGG